MNRILARLPGILEMTGIKRANWYNQLNEGLWPPPIALGPRARAWPVKEVELICNARIAGKSDEEIKKLVVKLVEERKKAN